MANLTDPHTLDRWRRNHDIMWVGTVIGNIFKTALGIGQKALGKFVLGDTPTRSQAWSKKLL